MAETISINRPLIPTRADQPIRQGERVDYPQDILGINMPMIGQIVYVKYDKKHYKITALNESKTKVISYEPLVGDLAAGALRWRGQVDSVEALEDVVNPKTGDVWNVTDVGNYSYVEPEVQVILSTSDTPIEITALQMPAADRVAENGQVSFVLGDNNIKYGALHQQGTSGKYYIKELVPNESGTGVVETSNVFILNNVDGVDVGADGRVIMLKVKAGEWVFNGSTGVTTEQMNAAITTAKTALQNDYNAKVSSKQGALSNDQLAACNSGITKAKLEDLEAGCLAEADPTNKIIKVKVKETDEYWYVPAVKLEAPVIDMGASSKVTTEAAYSIEIAVSDGAVCYYTTGGEVPTPGAATTYQVTATGGKIQIGVSGCLAAESKSVPVRIYAVKNGVKSQEKSAIYTISRKIAAPVISAKDDKYAESRVIEMSCATAGVSLYYTTDGSDPVVGGAKTSVYSADSKPSISADTTIKVMAVKSGWVNSQVVSSGVIQVGKPAMYAGLVDEAPTTLAGVKAMGIKKQDALPLVFQEASVTAQKKVCVAYPAALGDLTYIDGGGFDYTNAYEKVATLVGTYRLYVSKDPSNQKGIKYTFKK